MKPSLTLFLLLLLFLLCILQAVLMFRAFSLSKLFSFAICLIVCLKGALIWLRNEQS